MFINYQAGYLQILYCAQQLPRSQRYDFFLQLRAYMAYRVPTTLGASDKDLRMIRELIDIVEQNVQ